MAGGAELAEPDVLDVEEQAEATPTQLGAAHEAEQGVRLPGGCRASCRPPLQESSLALIIPTAEVNPQHSLRSKLKVVGSKAVTVHVVIALRRRRALKLVRPAPLTIR